MNDVLSAKSFVHACSNRFSHARRHLHHHPGASLLAYIYARTRIHVSVNERFDLRKLLKLQREVYRQEPAWVPFGDADSPSQLLRTDCRVRFIDTFASKVAACQDKYADASVGNVTGSNAVNVFLGIGIAWSIAAIYHSYKGSVFSVNPGKYNFSFMPIKPRAEKPLFFTKIIFLDRLAFSVTLFCSEACVVIVILMLRRSKAIGGELGGPMGIKILTSMVLFGLWIFYLIMSTLEATNYNYGKNIKSQCWQKCDVQYAQRTTPISMNATFTRITC
ncbi:unnamed protein product, partial [Trichogramma brassicae]